MTILTVLAFFLNTLIEDDQPLLNLTSSAIRLCPHGKQIGRLRSGGATLAGSNPTVS